MITPLSLRRFVASSLTVALLSQLCLAARDSRFEQAENLRYRRKPDEALVLYQALLATPTVSVDDKLRCQWGVIECLRAQQKSTDALTLARQVFDPLPADHWMRRQLGQGICDLLAQLNKFDEAAAQASALADASASDNDAASDWRMRCAQYHLRAKKFTDAYNQAGMAADIAHQSEDHHRALDALWLQGEAMFLAPDYEKCLVPMKRAIELKYDDFPASAAYRFRQRIADCFLKLNRQADARQAYQSFIATETDPELRQRWWLGIARSWETEKNTAQAIDAYEQLIIDHAEAACRDHWLEAQQAINRLQQDGPDTTLALQSARLCLDLADTKDRIQSGIGQVLGLLRKADDNLIRAKAFASFQQTGRAGADGIFGTVDDPADPLDDVGYPPNAARRSAFVVASAKLGCDAQASLHRGWMCMYIGRPREATFWFLDACRRGAGDEYMAAVNALVFSGARAASGSVAEVEEYADFMLHGSLGPTPHVHAGLDLPGPFTSLIDAPQLPASPLASEQRAALLELEKRLMASLEDGGWPVEMYPDAVVALERVHGSLSDWNTPGLLDWYLARFRSDLPTKTLEGFFAGALAAARGGNCHIAGIRHLFETLPDEEADKLLARGAARRAWLAWVQKLESQSRARTLVPRMNFK
jgi:hypothetical protein